jgi:allantoin racemase
MMSIKKNIRVINPIVSDSIDVPRTYNRELASGPYEGSNIKVSQETITIGTRQIESEYDEVLCIPQTLSLAIKAEREGVDAIVINCMSDPGLSAIREAVNIPVIGPNQAAMNTANMLGQKFGIVVLSKEVITIHEKLATCYGFSSRLVAVEPSGIHAHKIGELLENDEQEFFRILGDAAVAAVNKGAHSIILGCTGFLGCASGIKDYLTQQGMADVPVIDPIPNAILSAAKLCELRLTHSKKAYPQPLIQPRFGYDDSWVLLK